jgi:hypothetical protein
MKKILVILIFIALGGVAWGQIPLGSNFGLTSGIPLDNRTVKADLTERDAIPAVSRYEGLTVYVESEEAVYMLVGGITNSDWVEGSSGGTPTDSTWISITTDTIHSSGSLIYLDTSVYVSGDLDVTGITTAKQFKEVYPDTVDMDIYYGTDYFSTGSAVFNPQFNKSYIIPNTYSKNNYWSYQTDSLVINDLEKKWTHIAKNLVLNGSAIAGPARVAGFPSVVTLNEFISTTDITGNTNGVLLWPGVDDTIKADDVTALHVEIQGHTPESSSYVDITHMTVMDLYASLDDYMQIDSLTMLTILPRNTGIPADSITAYYGIYHKASALGQEIYGKDKTYFLYSEYGDNYLNGDLDVHGRMIRHYPDAIDMEDFYRDDINFYVWEYSKGTTDLTPYGARHNYIHRVIDTINILANTGRGIYYDRNFIGYRSDIPLTGNNYNAFSNVMEVQKMKAPTLSIIGNQFNTQLYTTTAIQDTIEIEEAIGVKAAVQTYTGTAGARIRAEDIIAIQTSITLDDLLSVDNAKGINIQVLDSNIDPDSIDNLYGIYNNDDGARGADATYFLYSEYGDNYLNGNLELAGGGELDQYGIELIIGSDGTGTGVRTDATGKSGRVNLPHYLNAEENVAGLNLFSGSSNNWVSLGGGSNSYNAATAVRLFAADNTTTTTGTQVANFNTSGLQLDTISELSTGEGISVKHDLKLFDGANLDIVGEKLTLGGDVTGYASRTTGIPNAGNIILPHVTNTEEPVALIVGTTETGISKVHIGGGNTFWNAVTDIDFYAAEDATTLAGAGTCVATIDSDGFLIDSIFEFTNDAGVYVEGSHFEDDDIEIAGAIKQTQLTGSLTDGAPSDAEIDTVTGTTPAAVGAGWQVTIKDNDGTGLLYRIESDGTNWFYMVMTQAS